MIPQRPPSGDWEPPPPSSIPNPFGATHRLLVLGQTRISTHSLPGTGEVSIGSERPCQIVVAEPRVAPRHAVLRMGMSMSLVDAGSGAPTMVAGRLLAAGEEAEVAPGVVIQLGGVAMVVQSSAASARLRHVRSHDYFEGRLEDECARAEARGGEFGVVRLRFSRRQARAVEEAFSRLLRSFDLVAMYAADEYELLLGDATREFAEALCDRLREHVRGAGLGELQAGLACWPRDGRSPEALLASAGLPIHGGGEPGQSSVPPAGAIEGLRPLLERVAPTSISVLVLGETGVGKEVLAHRIHELSPRASKPMLCVNCAALSETLLESELFGHERGAFTGAIQSKPGLLEAARGGTVFLDEIGELPLALQAKLLRVVEHREVTRLGGLSPRSIDVRFIAATNRDLEAEVARGAFRHDLYFRLNGISLVLPPLRERTGEIVPLATAFIQQFSRQSGRAKPPQLSRAASGLLERYAWPGNVRELRNVLERAVLLCPDDVIDLAHLPLEKLGRTLPSMPIVQAPLVIDTGRDTANATSSVYGWVQSGARPSPGAYSYNEAEHAVPRGRAERGALEPPAFAASLSREEAEDRKRVARALERCAGNQTHAARLLGISRRTLITRIVRYDLPRPRKRG